MRIFSLLIFTVLLLSFDASSQSNFNNRYDKWYFSYQSGLDFSTGLPTPLTNGKLAARQGTSSICDTLGNLQFYTDGLTVYNRNHVIMTNGTGLMGGQSVARSSIIVPFPTSPTKYYILTNNGLPSGGFTYGYRYSVVDMALQGGVGQVIVKNSILDQNSVESMAVCQHGNGTDYWLITHQFGNSVYKVWLINSNGITLSGSFPVGLPIIQQLDGGGRMRISHDGSHVATGLLAAKKIEVLDFDKFTGSISGLSKTISTVNQGMPNGIEFSADGRFLYYNTFYFQPGTQSSIYQLDLCESNSSSVQIYSNTTHYLTELVMGPDKKIYSASENQTYSLNPNFAPYAYLRGVL